MENAGNSFTLMPMSQSFLLVPGETYEGKITITNPADATSDFNYQAKVTPFSVSGTDYQIDLATKKNQSMMVDWITFDAPKGVLKPNESKELNYRIKVPKDAVGGGQYATIAVSQDESTESSESFTVDTVYEMASILYAEVQGEIHHEGKIENNAFPSFTTALPVFSNIRVSNNGNSHENIDVKLEISDGFTGRKIIPSDDYSGSYAEYIMPESEREINLELNGLPAVGIVNVKQTVSYLGEQSVVSKRLVICPIWFMVLVGLVVIGIVGLIVSLVIKHRCKKALVGV